MFYFVSGEIIGMYTHLVDIRVCPRVGQDVEACVDVVQQFDNLHGAVRICVASAIVCEADDTTEQDGDLVVLFGGYRAIMAKLIGNRGRQDRVQYPDQLEERKYFNEVLLRTDDLAGPMGTAQQVSEYIGADSKSAGTCLFFSFRLPDRCRSAAACPSAPRGFS